MGEEEEEQTKSKANPSAAGAETGASSPTTAGKGNPSRAGETPGLGRHRRRDAGIPRLTPRDVEALRWVGDQYACRLDHLQALLGRLGAGPIGASSTRAVLGRWEHQGLTARRAVLQGQPPWVWLTPRGLRTAGLSYAPWTPTIRTLWRAGAANAVRLFLEGRGGITWRSERALRLGQPQLGQVPAGELVDAAGALIGVEVEPEPRGRAARAAMLQALAGRYDAVWWFASAGAWAAVHETYCRLPREFQHLIRIYALEDV
jgi:hypothetical protein